MRLKPIRLRKMSGRDPHELHRVSTPLELFFDLVYVVAISASTSGFLSALMAGDWSGGFLAYLLSFLGVWISWLNYTWFASAYDTEDLLFRALTLIQILGALLLAVGLPQFYAPSPSLSTFRTAYVIMRIAMVLQWLRAAYDDPSHRKSCLTYAIGITLAQTLWLLRPTLPKEIEYLPIPILIAVESLFPFIAEKQGRTPWHPYHIAERYGLMAIIVLGESILGITLALTAIIKGGGDKILTTDFLFFGGLITVLIYSLWRSYFILPWGELLEKRPSSAFAFGYLHFLVYAALGAVGVGLSLAAQVVSNQGFGSLLEGVQLNLAIILVGSAVWTYLNLLNLMRIWLLRGHCSKWISLLLLPLLPLLGIGMTLLGAPLMVGLLTITCTPLLFVFTALRES